jgi:hypothetical protein
LDSSGTTTRSLRDDLFHRENAVDRVMMKEKEAAVRRWKCGICFTVARAPAKPHCSSPCECVALYCSECLREWLAAKDVCPSCKKKATCVARDRAAEEDIRALACCKCPEVDCAAADLTFERLLAHLEAEHDAPARRRFELEVLTLSLGRTAAANKILITDFDSAERQVAQLSEACLRKDELVESMRSQRRHEAAAARRVQAALVAGLGKLRSAWEVMEEEASSSDQHATSGAPAALRLPHFMGSAESSRGPCDDEVLLPWTQEPDEGVWPKAKRRRERERSRSLSREAPRL